MIKGNYEEIAKYNTVSDVDPCGVRFTAAPGSGRRAAAGPARGALETSTIDLF